MNTPQLIEAKKGGRLISMSTCYDSVFAKLLNRTEIDILLVGDSVATVIYGYDTTLNADIEMMIRHTEAVRRGAPEKMIVSDMPFISYRKGIKEAVDSAGTLMKSGANMVKLEGYRGNGDIITHLVESGIPVMGHLGLTPQFYHMFGGNKVQGRKEEQALRIFEDARSLQDSGCSALVLECVPSVLASEIAGILDIPVIGIGAGAGVDGQVLVMHDLLGLTVDFNPRFVRRYDDAGERAVDAFNRYIKDVKERNFPAGKESF